MGARAGKYKLGARVDKYKFGAKVGKYKLGARAGNTNLGTGPGPGSKQRAEGQEIQIPQHDKTLFFNPIISHITIICSK